jgi:hypothetical protein
MATLSQEEQRLVDDVVERLEGMRSLSQEGGSQKRCQDSFSNLAKYVTTNLSGKDSLPMQRKLHSILNSVLEAARNSIQSDEHGDDTLPMNEKAIILVSLLKLPPTLWHANMTITGNNTCVPTWVIEEAFNTFKEAFNDSSKHKHLLKIVSLITGCCSIPFKMGKQRPFDSMVPLYSLHQELMTVMNSVCFGTNTSIDQEILKQLQAKVKETVYSWLLLLSEHVHISKDKSDDLIEINFLAFGMFIFAISLTL